jgi:Ca2+-binding RTX toxin-like protein
MHRFNQQRERPMAIINGTDLRDFLVGDNIPTGNFFDAGDGNDIMLGGTGNDWFLGGKGADLMWGNSGNDFVDYHASDTGVFVNLAEHKGLGGYADGDSIWGIENVMGSNFSDVLIGDDGDNTLYGNGGDDWIHGGGGQDQLNGGDGNDTMFSDGGWASFDGGAGNDTADFSGRALGVNVNLANGTVGYMTAWNIGGHTYDLLNVENVNGTDHQDAIVGDAGDNILRGNGGDDFLTGGDGADTFAYDPAFHHGRVWGQNYTGPSFGHDTIMDFTPGQDHIKLDYRDFADFAAVQSHMTQVGNDTVITYDDHNSITLHNVSMASLHASDFQF